MWNQHMQLHMVRSKNTFKTPCCQTFALDFCILVVKLLNSTFASQVSNFCIRLLHHKCNLLQCNFASQVSNFCFPGVTFCNAILHPRCNLSQCNFSSKESNFCIEILDHRCQTFALDFCLPGLNPLPHGGILYPIPR